jgi:hypothetical protein
MTGNQTCFAGKMALARSLSEASFTNRLRAINSKVNNWRKKKNLSAVLLNKTRLRFIIELVQIRKRNLFSDDSLPFNKKKIVNNYAINLYINYFKRIMSLGEIKQPEVGEKIASSLLKLVLHGDGKKGFLPTASRTRLF